MGGRRAGAWTPEVRQAEATECGIAALAILMAHFGTRRTLPELRERLGDPRLGSTMGLLRRIAAAEGFRARGLRLEPAGLPPHLPAIVHLRFIHFAVAEAMGPRGVRLNDPAGGPRWVPAEEFARDFTGLVLVLAEPPAPSGAPPRLLRPLATMRVRLMAAAALSGLAGLAGAVAACFLGTVLAGGSPSAALGAGLAALALQSGATWAAEAARLRVAARGLSAGLREAGRDAPERLLWPGPRAARLMAPAALGSEGWTLPAVTLPFLLCAAAAAPALDFATGPALAALMLAGGGIALAPALRRAGDAAAADPGPPPAEAPGPSLLAEPGWWKTGGREAEVFADLAGRHALAADAALRAAAPRDAAAAWLEALLALQLLLPLGAWRAGWLEGDAALSLGALAAFASWAPRRLLAGFGLAGLKVALHRLAEPPPPLPPPALPLLPGPLSLRAEGLCWPTEGRGQPVLRSLSLDVPPGGALAVLGGPGAGKTALLRLACGLATPGGGTIALGSVPPARLPPGAVMLVTEDPFLPPLTVGAALRLDRPVPEAALREALALVELDAALAARGGLRLALARGGAELSGGEKRRLALARVLAGPPPGLLALDGALDALDPPLAARIVGRLRVRGMTLLVATRRRDIAALADRVLELEN